jgi:MYXO-CTERM domain-containing protein
MQATARPDLAATAAPHLRQRRRLPPPRPARARAVTHLVSAAAALLLATTAQAGPLTVSSYSMVNGATGNFAGYGDNAYNGSNVGGFLSGGTGDLTDGVLGGNVLAGGLDWYPYVLWLYTDPTITFDLGSAQSVNQLSAHFSAFGQAGVYLPGAALLRYSLDGSSFFGDTTFSFDHGPVGADEQRLLVLETATQQARYVQVQWQRDSSSPWMALSEVSLSNAEPTGTNGVPEPASGALALAALGALALARHRRSR